MRVECIMHVGNGGGCFYRGVRACVCARARARLPPAMTVVRLYC